MDMEIDDPIMDETSNFELPEHVLHKILSFLPRRDAIRASASSKQWRSAWISSPVFSFDEDAVPFKNSDFFDHVDASLSLWCDHCDSRLTMESLSLSAAISDQDSFSRLKQIVAATTSRNVKAIELHTRKFEFLIWTLADANSLLSILFACNSLNVLSLRCFDFHIPNSLSAISSLSKLTLSCSFIDENSLKNLLSCFPLLKDLAIGFCYGFNELHVSSPSLRTLEVTLCDDLAQKVVIDAVNLRHFTYDRTFRAPGIVSFSDCKSLTSLHIHGDLSTAWKINEYISKIPLLEDLILDGFKIPESIQISHSNLKSLKFKGCWCFSNAEINTPNLRLFRYCGGIPHVCTFKYCSGFLDAKLDLYTGSLDGTEWFWFIKLRNFLEIFSNCKVLSLACWLEGFTEELRDEDFLPDPLYELKHLEITNRFLPIEDYSSFVDAMMELFPGLETLTLKTSSARIFIEFDEYGSSTVEWFISTSDTEERNRINASVDEIVEVSQIQTCITKNILETEYDIPGEPVKDTLAAPKFLEHTVLSNRIKTYFSNLIGQTKRIQIEQKLHSAEVIGTFLLHTCPGNRISAYLVCLAPKNLRH